jgi:hypothetical protein
VTVEQAVHAALELYALREPDEPPRDAVAL